MKQLPRGLRLDKGYLQIRIYHDGHIYCKNFGRDCDLGRELAVIHLAEKRKEILMGKFGITPRQSRKRFSQVTETWMALWGKETTTDGRPAHSYRSVLNTKSILKVSLLPYFKDFWYDEIRAKDVIKWRENRLTDVVGTSINREQAVLSSIFSHVHDWLATERILPFQIPSENPTASVKFARLIVRQRILSIYELQKIKLAFLNRNDADGWTICLLALKSVLSLKDLRKLQIGDDIDIQRSKTGVPVRIAIPVLVQLNWKAFRDRWEAARADAGITDCQFRDLRKTGINQLLGHHDIKLISQYAAHASVKTTERSYTLLQRENLRPLSDDLNTWADAI